MNNFVGRVPRDYLGVLGVVLPHLPGEIVKVIFSQF